MLGQIESLFFERLKSLFRIYMPKHTEKKSKRRDNKKKDDKRRKRSSSSSSSDRVDKKRLEKIVKEQIEEKIVEVRVDESSRSHSRDRRKHRSRSRSRSHSRERHSGHALTEEFKCRMLKDCNVMPKFVDAFASIYNTSVQAVPQDAQLQFDSNEILKCVDHIAGLGDIYIRKQGLYFIHISVGTVEPNQFTLFVNGIPKFPIVLGSPNGADDASNEFLICLCKNDKIEIRNYTSSVPVVHTSLDPGGPLFAANAKIIMIRVAPKCELYKECVNCKCHDVHREEHHECIRDECTRDEEHLFCEIEKNLECDPELMINGSNAFGSAYSIGSQVVAVEQPILFTNNLNLVDVQTNLATGTITIQKSGIYYISGSIYTSQAAQFTLFVNGVAVPSSISGKNRGASQVLLRDILKLNSGDVLTIVNHTSALGSITSLGNAGGSETDASAFLSVFRIHPKGGDGKDKNKKSSSSSSLSETDNCRLYKKFIGWLECRKHFIRGVPAFFNGFCNQTQNINLNAPVIWQINGYKKKVNHQQGKGDIKVKESGYYFVRYDIDVNTAAQFTTFINDIPDITTVSGTVGAGTVILTQILKLKECDRLSVRNYTSLVGTITTLDNLFGDQVSINADISVLKISNCNDKL
jgi:hypothetical protein